MSDNEPQLELFDDELDDEVPDIERTKNEHYALWLTLCRYARQDEHSDSATTFAERVISRVKQQLVPPHVQDVARRHLENGVLETYAKEAFRESGADLSRDQKEAMGLDFNDPLVSQFVRGSRPPRFKTVPRDKVSQGDVMLYGDEPYEVVENNERYIRAKRDGQIHALGVPAFVRKVTVLRHALPPLKEGIPVGTFRPSGLDVSVRLFYFDDEDTYAGYRTVGHEALRVFATTELETAKKLFAEAITSLVDEKV